VWVGNFDGAPLRDASGITAAGPVFHDLMLAAMRGRAAAPLSAPSQLVEAEVCALSGARPTQACPHRRLERFLAGHTPAATCDMHVRCSPSGPVLERYPDQYLTWARQAGRPLATCSLASVQSTSHITFPRDRQSFALDPDGPLRQEILLTAASSAPSLRFVIDGKPSAAIAPPFRLPWQLTPGSHTLQIEGSAMPPITFQVITTDNY
jgi:penicillin-binding protein 1C